MKRTLIAVVLALGVALAGEGTGRSEPGSLNIGAKVTKPPKVSFTYEPFNTNGDQKWDGGEQVGLKLTVRNDGEGPAQGVKATLSGDDYLLGILGTVRLVGNIEPGRSADVQFDGLLPNDCPKKQAVLNVSVTYAPVVQQYIVALIPVRADTFIPKKLVLPAPDHFSNQRKNGYAIAIGIQAYQSAKPLKYSASDAATFAEYAKGVLGIPEANVRLLTNDKATKSKIEALLKDWLPPQKPKFIAFYYSGHGEPVFDPASKSWKSYILPVEADPTLKSTVIPVQELTDMLEATGADTILTFFDACFSGAGGKTPDLGQKPFIPPEGPELAKPSKAVIFASSSGDQVSQELDDVSSGLFSYYLFLGLKEGAGVDPNGWITLDNLNRYVQDNVGPASNNSQTPTLLPGALGTGFRLGRR